MANVEVDLIIEALAKGFDKIGKDLKGLGEAGEKAGDGAKKGGEKVGFLQSQLAKLVAGGALIAVGKALLDFGQASITAASDVEEMQSKFNTVFRDLAGPVTQELETFADAANRSKFDLMGFAATLQDTFVPLGFARDEAADMSVQLVKLAEDLASFNNLNTEDVVRDLQSALVGNTETLRKYGVVAQETQIKQEALSTGLWDGTGAISAQAKAQAILQLTLKGTTDAQGDAIKTADSYANVSKGLEAAMSDLKVAIGEGLLPQMSELKSESTAVIKGLAGWISTNHMLQKAVEDGVITQEEANRMIDKIALTSYTAADAQRDLANAYTEADNALTSANERHNEQARALEISAQFAEQARIAQEAETAALYENMRARSEAAAATGEFADKQEMVAASQAAYNKQLEEGIVVSRGMTGATEEEIKAMEDAAAAQEALRKATADYFTEAINAKDGIGLYNETAAEMADRTIYVSDLTRDQRTALSELQAEYDKAQGIIDDYTIGVKGVGLSTDEVNEKVAEQQERMAELQGAMEPLIGIGGEYAEVQGTMTINEDALNQSIFDSVAAQNASAEQLAILGGALGLYSEEAVEAALKTALIQAKIDELTAAWIEDGGSVEALRGEIMEFVASLDEIPSAVTTDIQVTGVEAAMGKIGSLQQQLNNLGGQAAGVTPGDATQRDTGDVGLAHGADFVVPPGFPNDSFGPLYVQSGERVQVTPAGQSGMGGGSQRFTLYYPQFYGVSDSQDMLKQLQDLST